MDSSQAEGLALRLSSHPELLSRFSQLLDVVEQVDGDRRTADAAEARTVESLRQLGSEVLHGWASTGVREHESDVDLDSCRRKGNFFLLAEQLRRDRCDRTGVLSQGEWTVAASFEESLPSGVPGAFPAFAADHDRFWSG